MDIVFVLDASASISEDKFRNKLCKYVADAVDSEEFTGDKSTGDKSTGDNTIKIGVIVYSSEVGTTIPLQEKTSRNQEKNTEKQPTLVQDIRDLKYIGDLTNTAGAIEAAKKLLVPSGKITDSRIKVMAVLTDGASDSPPATSEKAMAAKKAGIQIYAIGLGAGASQTEIKAIASFPNRRYAHNIDGFDSSSFDTDIQKLLTGLTYPCKFDALSTQERTVFNLYGVTPETRPKNKPLCGYYDMSGDNGTHGWALIINNYDFKPPNDLPGYQRDEEYLIETFRYLGYNVQVQRNLTRKAMQESCENIRTNFKGKSYDSFVCCVLSHGEDGKVRDSKNKAVEIDTLYDYFEGKSCKELIGKPKMFFFQSCRGSELDTAVDEKAADLPDLPTDYKVPSLADFFFGYATFRKTKAMVTEGGSRYVIELCKTLVLHSQYASLTEMMTHTNHMVGAQYIGPKRNGDEIKQAPVFSSSATKEVFFF